jgi:(S)-2-hydroxyglutarate dehydrogenase
VSRPADGREYDVAVVGAGLVGLATARALLHQRPGLRLVVVDAESRIAAHQSSHNSGVIHTGLYYRPGSLKARLCREGRAELLRFAEQHGIPCERRGKIVVARSDGELSRLEALEGRGRANGVEGLRMLEAHEIGRSEPAVTGRRALHVSESYVISYAAVAHACAREVAESGGDVVLGFSVTGMRREDGRPVLRSGERRVGARRVIGCAGLWADRLRALAGGSGRERILPFRGDYYTLTGASAGLVRGVVYPVPDPSLPFLGVHFTRGIDGSVHAGPNAVLALARDGYRRRDVNMRDVLDILRFPGAYRLAARYPRTAIAEVYRDWWKAAYVREARRYIPELDPADMRFGPSGVRAQCVSPAGELVDDFRLDDTAVGVTHVINAPSPAATACLAIGREVAGIVLG